MAMFDNAAVMSLSVDLIDPNIKGRIGFYHPLKAEALSALIVSDGQNDPIKVKSIKRGKYEWELIAGLHRLEACRMAGIEVKAIEVIKGDGGTYAEIQASENMHRRALGPIERACFVHALAEAANARVAAAHPGKSQQEIAVSAHWDKVHFAAPERAKDVEADTVDKMSTVYGWKEEVANALEMHPKALQRSLAIYRAVVAPNRTLARDLEQRDNPLTAHEIGKLVKIDPEKRAVVIKYLVEHPGVDRVEDALIKIGLKIGVSADSGQGKFTKNLEANWNRCSIGVKKSMMTTLLRLDTPKSFLPDLIEMMTPEQRDQARSLLDKADAS